MKKILVHDINIFHIQVLVVIGCDFNYLNKWVKKNAVKDLKDVFKELKEKDFETIGNAALHIIHGKQNYFLIDINKFNNDWDSYEILLHEIVHLKQELFKDRMIVNEDEFEAYFMQNTFHDIRKLIQNNMSCGKKKHKKGVKKK